MALSNYDGHAKNLVACIRSDDDGRTWSDVEVVASRPDQGCWAPSLFRHKDKAYLFWYTKSAGWQDMTNRLMSTGEDGRTFTDDRAILEGWNPGHIVDVRHGTHLRDGRVLLPIAWQEPLKPTDDWKPPGGAVDLRNVGGDSDDGMKTWAVKRTLVAAPKVAQYPDGFYDEASGAIYLAWEDGRAITFQIIPLAELQRDRS